MSATENLVLAPLKEKNPALHRTLAASGELMVFVTERADEIADYSPPLEMSNTVAAENTQRN